MCVTFSACQTYVTSLNSAIKVDTLSNAWKLLEQLFGNGQASLLSNNIVHFFFLTSGKEIPIRMERLTFKNFSTAYLIWYGTLTIQIITLRTCLKAQGRYQQRSFLESLTEIMMGMHLILLLPGNLFVVFLGATFTCSLLIIFLCVFNFEQSETRVCSIRYLSADELLPIVSKLHPGERFYAKQQADYTIMQVMMLHYYMEILTGICSCLKFP